MKGQFFLIVAFSLVLFYFIGFSAYLSPPGVIEQDYYSNLPLFFNNIMDEFPKVANFGINESKPVEHLSNFTAFVNILGKKRGMDVDILWILFQNDSGDVSVTVGNYLGSAINFTLNTSTEVNYIFLNDQSSDSALFSPNDFFNISVIFNSNETILSLEKYKTNLYYWVSMSRGDNVLRGERKA